MKPPLFDRKVAVKLHDMRHLLLIFTFTLCWVCVEAQTFSKRYGENNDLGYAINARSSTIGEDKIYTLIIENTDAGTRDALYTIDLGGNLLETYEYPMEEGDYSVAGFSDNIIYRGDNEVVYSGGRVFDDTLSLGFITSIVNGEVSWVKYYGDSIHNHFFQQVKLTMDNGFLAVGSAGLSSGLSQFYVVKTDSLGNEEWHAYLGQENKYSSGGYVSEKIDGSGFAVSGFEDKTDWDPVGLAYILDVNGNILDSRKYTNWGLYDDQSIDGMIPTSDGNFIFNTVYNVEEIGILEYNRYSQLVKVNMNLDTIWTCNLTPVPNEGGPIIVIEDDNGDYVTVGIETLPSSSAISEGQISKVNSQGELLWHRNYVYAEHGRNLLHDIDEMPNGGYLCTGWIHGIPAGGDTISGQDAWLLAVDSMGCLVPGCDTIISVSEIEPIEFSVYPNPADDFINVAFSKHLSAKDAHLEVYNMRGRKVKETKLLHEKATYMLDSSGLPNGNYILKLRTNDFQKSEQIIIQH